MQQRSRSCPVVVLWSCVTIDRHVATGELKSGKLIAGEVNVIRPECSAQERANWVPQ